MSNIKEQRYQPELEKEFLEAFGIDPSNVPLEVRDEDSVLNISARITYIA